MSAKFHINAVFTISGRGTVLQGTIVEGEISRGMNIAVPGMNRTLIIGTIEAIHGPGIPLDSIGLLLRQDATAGPDELRPLVEGEIVEINPGAGI